MLVMFSCRKQDVQPQLISQLGFDVNKTIAGNSSTTPAMSFNSIEEAKTYLQTFKGRSISGNIRDQKLPESASLRQPDIYDHEGPPEGGGGENNVVIIDWHGWAGYQATFTWNKDGNGLIQSVGNFSSSLVGFTLGVSWTHQNGSATYKGDVITYSINGIQNYNIIVEGIGTLFSQHVNISGTYNTKTGAFTVKEK